MLGLFQKRRLISCVCSQEQLESAAFQRWARIIKEPHMTLHRKLWEWCYISQALEERGMLRQGARGLGFAVGREPLSSLFASRGCAVVATDLDVENAKQAGWVDTNQHADSLSLLNERGLCPPDQFARLVSFRSVDMNDIPGDLRGFDFLWSSCSLEHLGSIQHGLDYLVNSLECLRPGGVAVHTTEFNVSSNSATLERGQTVIFRRRDFEEIVGELRGRGHRIEISYKLGTRPADTFVDVPPYKQQTHLRLQLAEYVSTSIGLIIEKGQAARASAPRRRGPAQEKPAAPLAGPLTNAQLPALVAEARPELRTPVPLCKVANLPEYSDPTWLDAARTLGLPTDGQLLAKKYWEYTHLLYGLRRLDCVRPGVKMLAVGSGVEPPMYYLSNHIGHITGIDLFDGEIADAPENPGRHATVPYDPERLTLITMNGCDLKFEDESFDVVFSLSSIEHFGGHDNAAVAMREAARVLRPGGIAAFTTEFMIGAPAYHEFFTWQELWTYIVEPSGLDLVEPVDWSISPVLRRHYVNVRDVRSPLYMLIHAGPPPQVNEFTSVFLFFRKPEAGRRPNARELWDASRPDYIA